MTIRAISDHVVVRRERVNSIIEIVGHKDHCGTVVAVGPGRLRADPETGREWLCPTSLQPGDRVLYSHRAGMEQAIDGETLLVMHESDVLCVLEPDATVGMGDDWRAEQSTQVGAYETRGGKAVRV